MKKLNVYYSGWGEHWILGSLADNGKNVFFEYTPEALRQGLEISPLSLKLSTQTFSEFPQFQMRLPGFISDSLPDGWGLMLMDKLFRKEGLASTEVSPLDRLSFLGSRAIGALSFEPKYSVGQEKLPDRLLEVAKKIHKVVQGTSTSALKALAIMGGSPHGARPKVLVNFDSKSNMISSDSDSIGDPWLVKFQGDGEHKEVCAIEALYAQLARRSGLTISETNYFDLSKDLAAFGSKRFDRVGKFRVPVHTLAGALHANFRVPSSVSYNSYLRATRFFTKDEREVSKAFRQCVFNVLFNNRDDHSKNFSFCLAQDRNWKLSTAYDLTFNEGPGGEHQMDICGEGREPGSTHLMWLAKDSGLNEKTCRHIIDEVKEASSGFLTEAKNWPIRKATIKKIEKKIVNNRNRL